MKFRNQLKSFDHEQRQQPRSSSLNPTVLLKQPYHHRQQDSASPVYRAAPPSHLSRVDPKYLELLKDLENAIIEDRLFLPVRSAGNRLRLSIAFITGVLGDISLFIRDLIGIKGVRYIVYDERANWVIVVAENNSELCMQIRQEVIQRRAAFNAVPMNVQSLIRG